MNRRYSMVAVWTVVGLAVLTLLGPRVVGHSAMADTSGAAEMSQGGVEPFLGQIQAFGFNFAPRGWAKCDGGLLQISQHSALFSLLGTTYGGDGETTFGLPDLRGRTPIHQGQGPGLTNRIIGQKAGAETVTLTASNMPTHTHAATLKGTTQAPPPTFEDTPTGKVLAKGNEYSDGNSDTDMGASSITNANTGGGQAHANMQPFLTVNYCIALTGVFPSRNLGERGVREPGSDGLGGSSADVEVDTGVQATRLFQNSPNPFNPNTTLRFSLASRGPAELSIYDVSGRKVKALVDGVLEAGSHEVVWDGTDDAGRELSSGVYWSYFEAASLGVKSKKKMVLLKDQN